MKEPRTCPKSCASSSVDGSAAALTATKRPARPDPQTTMEQLVQGLESTSEERLSYGGRVYVAGPDADHPSLLGLEAELKKVKDCMALLDMPPPRTSGAGSQAAKGVEPPKTLYPPFAGK